MTLVLTRPRSTRGRWQACAQRAICPRFGAGCSYRAAAPAGGPTLPIRTALDAPQERAACNLACTPDPEVPVRGPVQWTGTGIAVGPALAR